MAKHILLKAMNRVQGGSACEKWLLIDLLDLGTFPKEQICQLQGAQTMGRLGRKRCFQERNNEFGEILKGTGP